MKDLVLRYILSIRFDMFDKQDSIENRLKQFLQELVLYSLSRTSFFNYAAFHGGTSLRLFYNLDRFSEDLDFALTRHVNSFNLKDYFTELDRGLRSFGLRPIISAKNFDNKSTIQSCVIKFNTINELKKIYPEKSFKSIHKDSITKIKFDVDMNYLKSAKCVDVIKSWPFKYKCTLHDISTLFAGKLNALITRGWINRVKGRDLYDYLFYLGKNTKFNIDYLKEKLINNGSWKKKSLSLKDVKELLIQKFKTLDYDKARNDVRAFIQNENQLKYWDANYFIKSLDKLEREE